MVTASAKIAIWPINQIDFIFRLVTAIWMLKNAGFLPKKVLRPRLPLTGSKAVLSVVGIVLIGKQANGFTPPRVRFRYSRNSRFFAKFPSQAWIGEIGRSTILQTQPQRLSCLCYRRGFGEFTSKRRSIKPAHETHFLPPLHEHRCLPALSCCIRRSRARVCSLRQAPLGLTPFLDLATIVQLQARTSLSPRV